MTSDSHDLARRVINRLNSPPAPRNIATMPDVAWKRARRQLVRQMRQAETAFNALFGQHDQDAAACLSVYLPTIGDDPFLLDLSLDGATVTAVGNRLQGDATARYLALEVIKRRWLCLHPSVVAVGSIGRGRACEIAERAVQEIVEAQQRIAA